MLVRNILAHNVSEFDPPVRTKPPFVVESVAEIKTIVTRIYFHIFLYYFWKYLPGAAAAMTSRQWKHLNKQQLRGDKRLDFTSECLFDTLSRQKSKQQDKFYIYSRSCSPARSTTRVTSWFDTGWRNITELQSDQISCGRVQSVSLGFFHRFLHFKRH